MEEKKKGNGLVIGILVGIIVCLLLLVGLLVSGVISFKFDSTSKKEESGTVIDEEGENNNFDISYKEEVKEYKNKDGKVIISNKRNLPVIDSNNKDVADKIANYLANISDEDWNNLNKNQSEDDDFVQNYSSQVGVSYLFSTKVINDNYVSIDYTMSGSMGGVSWAGNWGYNFNSASGEVLKIEDVMDYDSARESLYNYIISDVEKTHDQLWNDDTAGNWKDIAKENMFKLGSWYFTDNGITVTFDKYLLGPGATGVVTVDIPFSELNKYLKDEYQG